MYVSLTTRMYMHNRSTPLHGLEGAHALTYKSGRTEESVGAIEHSLARLSAKFAREATATNHF